MSKAKPGFDFPGVLGRKPIHPTTVFENDPDAMEISIVETENGECGVDIDPRHLIWACEHDQSEWIRDAIEEISDRVAEEYITEANVGETVAQLKAAESGVIYQINRNMI